MSDYIVAITGGVASGKSEVSRRFQALGVAVADADIAARTVVEPGTAGLAEIVATFGGGVLDAHGRLDRAAMRRRVFDDTTARQALEAIIHPRVRAQLQEECRDAAGAYAMVAVPLLTEVGGREAYPWVQRILVVDVPVEVQHARLMLRDGADRALADRMIAAQATREQRLAIADDVLVNDGALDQLAPHIEALDRRYRALASALDIQTA
ncbi:dephospho-CoA kinase [Agrilutibacter solisilvae]|uniref:Dephospho-CoA kinase n=1 Tax=Agrilutibacter solisilvae TaxID=2763317 RepID=A0A975ASR7_9GAMM|nr:dephospho-CoA kinase [Lysobacter solisilvae]QSX78548.1 dephospho-CoA kinase [Lysobacter solisilvae]